MGKQRFVKPWPPHSAVFLHENRKTWKAVLGKRRLEFRNISIFTSLISQLFLSFKKETQLFREVLIRYTFCNYNLLCVLPGNWIAVSWHIHFYVSPALLRPTNDRPLILWRCFWFLWSLLQVFPHLLLLGPGFHFLFYCCFSELVEELVWGLWGTWWPHWLAQTSPGLCILDLYILNRQTFVSACVYRYQSHFGRKMVSSYSVIKQVKDGKAFVDSDFSWGKQII